MKQDLLISNVGNVDRLTPFVCGIDPGKSGYMAFVSPNLKMCRTFPLERAPKVLQMNIVSLDMPLEKLAMYSPLGVFIEDQFQNKNTMMDLGALSTLAEFHQHHFSAYDIDCFRIVHSRRWQKVLGVNKNSYHQFADSLNLFKDPHDTENFKIKTRDEAAAICVALYGIIVLIKSGILSDQKSFKYNWE